MQSLKSLLVISFLIFGLLPTTPSLADTAAVTGKVKLQAKSKDFPDELLEIFQGHEDSLPKGKNGKNIEVEATYTGESRLRVSEIGEFEDSENKYFFDIPIPSVMQSFTSKKARATRKSGLISLIFDSLADLNADDNTNSGNDNFDFGSNSLVKAFKISPGNKKRLKKRAKISSGSAGQSVSILKLVATRKGNKGTVKGTFTSSDKKAKGRFALKFNYEE